MGNACKVMGYIWSILGVIGSFVSAYLFGMSTRASSFLQHTYYHTERNWLLTIAVFIVTLLSVMVISIILFALSEVISYVESLKYDISAIRSDNSGLSGDDSHIDISSIQHEDASWVCPQCNTENSKTSMFCQNCGAYR